MDLPISLLLVFTVLLSPLTALAEVSEPRALGLARSSFPSVHAQQLIRALNLFPESDANIITSAGDSSPIAAGRGSSRSGSSISNIDRSSIPAFIPKLSSSRLIGCKSPKCAWIFGPEVNTKCPKSLV